VIIEKPFGRDLESARDLNRVLHEVFPEPSIYRIDHYLGKEATQNIIYFRFSAKPTSPTCPVRRFSGSAKSRAS